MTPRVNVIDAHSSILAEPIRLALTAGGVPSEDIRYCSHVMNILYPGKRFPSLEIIGQIKKTTLQYAEVMAGIYPISAMVDFVVDLLESLNTQLRSDTSFLGHQVFIRAFMPGYKDIVNTKHEHDEGPFLLGKQKNHFGYQTNLHDGAHRQNLHTDIIVKYKQDHVCDGMLTVG